jgi:DNA polymerase (family 10)
MTNKEIASVFNNLGKIMELHGENPFKIRSYSNAYLSLRKLETPLGKMSDAELGGIKGIGKAIVSKVRELQESGRLEAMEKYKALTPPGVQEMLQIKGFGPKKVRVVWKDLGAETIGELLYACNENRLIELKGFGAKTQEDLKQKLEYFLNSKNKFHYASLEPLAQELIEKLKPILPGVKIAETGALRRRCPELERVEVLVGTIETLEPKLSALFDIQGETEDSLAGRSANNIPIIIYKCSPDEFGSKQFRYTGGGGFINAFLERVDADDFRGLATEAAVFSKAKLPVIAPELRDWEDALVLASDEQLPVLIEESDIKGVIHSHTTYSDGLHSLRDMVEYAKAKGFGYIGITDHSKSAFYANGLQPERVYQQMEEIDQLNAEMNAFRIFKGIESDILNDGSLDYEDDLLGAFDFIIASVHSNLKMDEAKATHRIITAVENPYTSMLGHPTGRLLLSREGYPLDHKKVIDACAANGVVIEINANPYRLDLDWTWIPYAIEKGVKLSINPDAHSKGGMHDIRYGVLAARKGGLSAVDCVNCFDAEGFLTALRK